MGKMVFYASIPASTAQRLTASFHDALPPIDIDQAPLVSEYMALQAMQKRLSDIASLGSQVRVGPAGQTTGARQAGVGGPFRA